MSNCKINFFFRKLRYCNFRIFDNFGQTNINRLNDEYVNYNYNFLSNPKFDITEHHLRIKKQIKEIKLGVNVQEIKHKTSYNYEIFYR